MLNHQDLRKMQLWPVAASLKGQSQIGKAGLLTVPGGSVGRPAAALRNS